MLTTLQFGRGLAAIAVAAFHLSALMVSPAFGGTSESPFRTAFGEGYLGVDFFFVLSGFIILHAHESDVGRPQRLTSYGYKRFIRIYPIYWLYLAACIVGMVAVKSSFFQLSSVADWVTTIGLFKFSTVALPLPQAWTLFHEMTFYVMFSLLLVNRTVGMIAIGVWMTCVAIRFTYPSSAGQDFQSVLLAAYNLNFLVGMIAYKVSKSIRERVALALFVIGIALFLYAFRAFRLEGGGLHQLLIGISFGVILAGAAALELRGRLRLPLWLGIVGDASYSIYLLHEHLETYSARALKLAGITPTTAPIGSFWLILAITIVGGCVAYVCVERPLLRAMRKLWPAQTGASKKASMAKAT